MTVPQKQPPLNRYSFSWAVKRDAIRLLETPTRATLVPYPSRVMWKNACVKVACRKASFSLQQCILAQRTGERNADAHHRFGLYQ